MVQEEINCPVCGSSSYRLLFKSRDFRFCISEERFNIVRCNECGFIILNPRPQEDALTAFYPSDFNKRPGSLFYKAIEPAFKIAQQLTINLISKYKPEGKALDIGCGNGDFLLAMQKKGFDVYGVEPNKDAKEFCPAPLGGRIFYNSLKESNFQPKTFDVITCFQSLEHVYNLKATLLEMNRIIKDNGILYICVPNSEFLEARLFGPYYYNLEAPRHLYFFSKKTLGRLLSAHGFRVERFMRDSLFEFVSTPASFYHSLLYWMRDKNLLVSNTVKLLLFVPLVLIRFMLRILFIFETQNLKVFAVKNENI